MPPALGRGSSTRALRRSLVGLCACLAVLAQAAAGIAGERIQVRDLDNRLVDPFETDGTGTGVVLLFVSRECPISNRYAPEIRRLRTQFAPEGLRFWLVFPNPADGVEEIRDHLAAFDFGVPALRDPMHTLVAFTGVTMTPEAAIYDGAGRLAYRGRIDDRHVRLGLTRPAPTTHDLRDALMAMLAGRLVPAPAAPAVGCYISDFVHAH
jgi:hypothetical protein